MPLKSFYQFMKEKSLEYYSQCKDIGQDFFTAPELDRAFGYAVGELASELLKDYPQPAILELGAGRGTLAYDILSFLRCYSPKLFERLHYLIYDFSQTLKEKQRKLLRDFGNKVFWVDEVPKFSGLVLSNEFFDCLPVRIVKGRKELYLEDGKEIWLPLEDLEVKEYMERLGMKEEDVAYEVCLDCVRFLEELVGKLSEGYILTIDYGYLEFPKAGTVVGYRGHKLVKDVYSNEPFDITASVNFRALMEYGKDFGLEVVFFKNQRDFLLSSRVFVGELSAVAEDQSPQALDRLSRLKTMLVSMGERFKVLLQRKGS
jgi:SAM-dependent MidA family methyltransferase